MRFLRGMDTTTKPHSTHLSLIHIYRDDGDHEAGVHAVVELLHQGRQDDAAQDRAVHVRGTPDAREHAQEEGEEQGQADQAVGEDNRPELALRA